MCFSLEKFLIISYLRAIEIELPNYKKGRFIKKKIRISNKKYIFL